MIKRQASERASEACRFFVDCFFAFLRRCRSKYDVFWCGIAKYGLFFEEIEDGFGFGRADGFGEVVECLQFHLFDGAEA
jgi:hypothetical protein